MSSTPQNRPVLLKLQLTRTMDERDQDYVLVAPLNDNIPQAAEEPEVEDSSPLLPVAVAVVAVAVASDEESVLVVTAVTTTPTVNAAVVGGGVSSQQSSQPAEEGQEEVEFEIFNLEASPSSSAPPVVDSDVTRVVPATMNPAPTPTTALSRHQTRRSYLLCSPRKKRSRRVTHS